MKRLRVLVLRCIRITEIDFSAVASLKHNEMILRPSGGKKHNEFEQNLNNCQKWLIIVERVEERRE